MQVTSQGAETSREKAYLKVNSPSLKHKSSAKSEEGSEQSDYSKPQNKKKSKNKRAHFYF